MPNLSSQTSPSCHPLNRRYRCSGPARTSQASSGWAKSWTCWPCWRCCWPCCWLCCWLCWPCCWPCRGLAGGKFVSCAVVPLSTMLLTVLMAMMTMMTRPKTCKKWYFAYCANQHLVRSTRVLPSRNMLQVTLMWKNELIDNLKRNYLKKKTSP